jgi:hypothetical protein
MKLRRVPEWVLWVIFTLAASVLGFIWDGKIGWLLFAPVVRSMFVDWKKENEEINRQNDHMFS